MNSVRLQKIIQTLIHQQRLNISMSKYLLIDVKRQIRNVQIRITGFGQFLQAITERFLLHQLDVLRI